jgi:hypothetical protein
VRFLVAALTIATSAHAHAQKKIEAERWQFELTPYFWAAGLKGDTQVGNLPRTKVDVEFSDILDNLDFALMGAFEARRKRWGFLFDTLYIKLSASGTASRTGPGPIGATATARADLKVKQTILAAAVAYRAVEGPTAVDLLGGLRYTKLDVSGDITASLFGLAGTVSRSGDKDWIDPIVGLRVHHAINDRWSLSGYADYGGFGAGSDSTWQVITGVNYEFSKRIVAKAGYRVLNVDYDKGSVLYDMKTYGPYLAVGVRF